MKMMMIKRTVLTVCLLATAFVTTGRAQQGAPPVPKLMTFRVDVTLTRLAANNTLGTSPYSLLVNSVGSAANPGRASLRIGVEVPTGTQTRTSSSSGTTTTDTVFKNVGTQIDAYVSAFDDQRYAVDVTINDSAIFSDGANADRLAQATTRRNAAARNLARVEELFKKNLATKDAVANAQAQEQDATAALAIAQKGGKSLGPADQMAFRSFTSSNRVYLRDGESQEMTVATDRTSGETVRASVKLTVVK